MYRNYFRSAPKHRVLFALFLFGMVGLTGCGASGDTSTNGPNAANISNTEIAANQPGSVDGNAQPTGDANAMPGTLANGMANKAEMLRTGDSNQAPDMVHPGLRAQPLSRPAPDDSEYSATLTDVARETRKFRRHAVLDRVEKVNDGRTSSVKIFLKSGRVIDLPGERIPQLATISSAEILKIAGLPPISAPTPPPAASKNERPPEKQRSSPPSDPE